MVSEVHAHGLRCPEPVVAQLSMVEIHGRKGYSPQGGHKDRNELES